MKHYTSTLHSTEYGILISLLKLLIGKLSSNTTSEKSVMECLYPILKMAD